MTTPKVTVNLLINQPACRGKVLALFILLSPPPWRRITWHRVCLLVGCWLTSQTTHTPSYSHDFQERITTPAPNWTVWNHGMFLTGGLDAMKNLTGIDCLLARPHHPVRLDPMIMLRDTIPPNRRTDRFLLLSVSIFLPVDLDLPPRPCNLPPPNNSMLSFTLDPRPHLPLRNTGFLPHLHLRNRSSLESWMEGMTMRYIR